MDSGDVVASNGKRPTSRDFAEKVAQRGEPFTRIMFIIVVVAVAIEVVVQLFFLARGVRVLGVGWNVLLAVILVVAVFCRAVLPRLVGGPLSRRYAAELGAGEWPRTVFRRTCVEVVRDGHVVRSVDYSQVHSAVLTKNLYVVTFVDGSWLAVRRDGFSQGTLADVGNVVEQRQVGA